MSGISALVAVVAGVIGIVTQRPDKPPQPFDENVSLPGKVPAAAKDLTGAWMFQYRLPEATLETGKSALHSLFVLELNKDGTYRLQYSARWNLPRSPLPGIVRKPTMDGRNVVETGRYSLSGEVLLLEPSKTEYWEIEDSRIINQQTIRNENRPLIVRLEKRRLSVAGRCAHWQIDPICQDAPANWYPMQKQIGGGRGNRGTENYRRQ